MGSLLRGLSGNRALRVLVVAHGVLREDSAGAKRAQPQPHSRFGFDVAAATEAIMASIVY